MDAREKLKVLVVVGEFPAISNPFIFNQITGLIDLGHDVSIFALKVVDQQCEHSEIEEYQLRDKLYVLDETETTKWGKVKYVVKNGIPLIIRKPRVLLAFLIDFSTCFFHGKDEDNSTPR